MEKLLLILMPCLTVCFIVYAICKTCFRIKKSAVDSKTEIRDKDEIIRKLEAEKEELKKIPDDARVRINQEATYLNFCMEYLKMEGEKNPDVVTDCRDYLKKKFLNEGEDKNKQKSW